jgi:hypothetical protein
MATANLSQIDDNLKQMLAAQPAAPAPTATFEDRSELLYAQMNFIAVVNRRALNLP